MSLFTRRGLAALFLATVCAAGLGARPAAAAKKPAEVDPNQASFVDLNRVLSEYRKSSAFQRYQKQLQERSVQFGDEMKFLADLRFVTDMERGEAVKLKFKPAPTAAEKSRLDEIINKSSAAEKELTELSQKQKPTEADTKRIGDLNNLRNQTLRALAQEEGVRREALAKMDSDLTGMVQDELLKVVEKVAKEQKIAVIYDRRAVLYGGNDLTDEVVKHLPK